MIDQFVKSDKQKRPKGGNHRSSELCIYIYNLYTPTYTYITHIFINYPKKQKNLLKHIILYLNLRKKVSFYARLKSTSAKSILFRSAFWPRQPRSAIKVDRSSAKRRRFRMYAITNAYCSFRQIAINAISSCFGHGSVNFSQSVILYC